jgi:hypothetical protein
MLRNTTKRFVVPATKEAEKFMTRLNRRRRIRSRMEVENHEREASQGRHPLGNSNSNQAATIVVGS